MVYSLFSKTSNVQKMSESSTSSLQTDAEALLFIKKKKYETPIVFTKSFPFQDLEGYYAGHEKFQTYVSLEAVHVPSTCAVGPASSHMLYTVASHNPNRLMQLKRQKLGKIQDMFYFQQ